MDFRVCGPCGQSGEVHMRIFSKHWDAGSVEDSWLNQSCFPWNFFSWLTTGVFLCVLCVLGLYIFFSNLIFRNDDAEILAVVNFSRQDPNTRYPFLS